MAHPLYDRVKQFRLAKPFLPFEIRMADGVVYTVDEAGFLALSARATSSIRTATS